THVAELAAQWIVETHDRIVVGQPKVLVLDVVVPHVARERGPERLHTIEEMRDEPHPPRAPVDAIPRKDMTSGQDEAIPDEDARSSLPITGEDPADEQPWPTRVGEDLPAVVGKDNERLVFASSPLELLRRWPWPRRGSERYIAPQRAEGRVNRQGGETLG